MCLVLVPNIGISTSISNTTQIRPQHFRKVMCVHWECAWCQCQILVLAPAYPTLHKYAHSTSQRSCVSTGNVRGASAKYWYQNQHIQHYTNTPTVVKKLHVCPLGICVVLLPNICLAPAYPKLHKYVHSTSETSCESTGNVRGASAKYWFQHQHIQHYRNTSTALQKGHVCPLGMCVVLVPNIGISTSISNTTEIRPQNFRNFMCVHWNVRGASVKYWYQHQHIQHYTNTPTALQKGHVCPLGMCVVLVPNIGISTSISNTTQIRPQHFRKVMCVHWECAWCQCQILVLAQPYSTLHKYAHSTSERSCVFTGNVLGASAKYWYKHQHIQHYTNTSTALQKGHVCPLGMCVVLVPNIGISTSISNTTQIRPLQLRNFICVHWEFAWIYCQIFVQHQHIQHYRNTSTALQKLHVSPLGMCVVLVPNIGISTSISNTTEIRPQNFRNFMCVHWECAWCQCQILVLAPAYPTLHKYAHSTSERSCVSTGNVRGGSAKYWYQHQYIQHYTNTPTALQKGHVCPLGMCVVLVPNIGISTSISNTTQIRPQHFRKVKCVHWECAWCQCQILVLAPAYPTLQKYAHSTSQRSCVSTGNVRGASAKYWYQNQHIQHYTNTPTVVKKLHVCPLGICVVLLPNICLAPAYPKLHKYVHSTSETSCESTGNVRGASAKYWFQHQHIQHYRNTPTALQKLHVCPLGMCVVLVPIICISTSISNTTQIRPQNFGNSCVSTENVRGASAKYWYQHQHIQHYTNTPTELQKGHVCTLGMCVVLVQNIGISTTIFNTTQIRPQHFRKVMCVHWECAWCQCQILVLAPAYL